jgi:hypothetical protein
MPKKTHQGLLPVQTGQTRSQSSQVRTADLAETVPHRRGAALQLDEFNLFVGRALFTLGVVGNCIEIGTTCKAFLIRFADNPGPQNVGYWPEFGLSLFFAFVFQTALWVLVVNLNDSWVTILSGHPKEAFVSKGEVNQHLLLLYCFQFGGAAINGLCDSIFLSNITSDPLLIGLGTAALLISSILLWPLGWKLVRHSMQRIKLKKAIAKQLAQQHLAQSGQPAVNVSPVVSGSVVPYKRQGA